MTSNYLPRAEGTGKAGRPVGAPPVMNDLEMLVIFVCGAKVPPSANIQTYPTILSCTIAPPTPLNFDSRRHWFFIAPAITRHQHGCVLWIMGHQLPPNLVLFFTRALKTFQLSKAKFSILCSLPPGLKELAPRPPSPVPHTLLVLDSSFNPPTLAHQRMALSALRDEKYGTDARVLLLLAINNADKAPKPASFPQRLAMMYLLALDLLADLEVTGSAKRTEVDLAVTTEPYFHSKGSAIAASEFYSAHPARMEQIYLTGFDTLIRIFDPKYYPNNSMRTALDPFLSYSSLRVTTRTDADWGDAAAQRAYLDNLRNGALEQEGGRKEWAAKIELVEGRKGGEEVISSTKIRDAVQREDWARLRELASDAITDWVREERLYREDAE